MNIKEYYGFIYITTCKVNGKKYIGQKKFNRDWEDYLGSGTILKRAIKLYGEDKFERVIIDKAKDKEELDLKEIFWINFFDAVNSKEYYNIHEGGCGGNTFEGKTEEEKEIFRQKMKILNQGRNNGMYGKHHSEESKKKMSENRDNKNNPSYHSQEYRDKISKNNTGEGNPMYGRHHSEESKKKMSKNSKGKTSGEKNGMYGKRGEKALNGKKVYMFQDEEHLILIKEFNSVNCVLEFLNLKGHEGLYKAIKNNTIYKNYYWSKNK